MERMYKVGTRRVDEGGLIRMYQVLDELRWLNVYNMERYIVLSACMEELAKRSKRLKSFVEQTERRKHETDNRH